MIYFIICSALITFFAVMMCLFSGQQQRKEDEYLNSQGCKSASGKKYNDRADWDLLNNWDDPEESL